MSLNSRMNEIKLDIDDLNSLIEHASRQKSKDLLGIEIRRLQTELINIQNQLGPNQENNVSKPTSDVKSKCYEVKINNYAWDQTNDFIKIYVTLNKVQSLPKEAVYCNFTERSMDLRVLGLENKNYTLLINNLYEDINESKSHIKVKTDLVIIYLAKKSKNNWSCITSIEKRLKEAKSATTPNLTDKDDPGAGIMNLMKKMYQEGDDEMKKTIAKAWTESQEKKEGGLSGLGGLGNF